MPISLEPFFNTTQDTFLEAFHPALREALDAHYVARHHGRTEVWDQALDALPKANDCQTKFTLDNTQDRLSLVASNQTANLASAHTHLEAFKPWRKGPWQFCNIDIDTEWRSDWKWNRIARHITPLSGRSVLDVGCGNGYFLYRMLGAGADLAIGVDPTRIFLYQFHCFQQTLTEQKAHILPLRSEHLPAFNQFDTVFCLGVLYHRRSPIEQLEELQRFLRPGGELVLETLVVDGDDTTVLVPQERYSKMANVWFIPSAKALKRWLERVGFSAVRTVDITPTTIGEQQATAWMDFQSLEDFLDPEDPSRTIEGYPAPKRATLIATR